MTNEELVKQIQQTQDPGELLGQLYQQNHGWICQCVKKYSGLADFDDLTQEAYFAVRNAALGFDPEKGTFIGYLTWHIKRQIGRYLVGHGRAVKLPEYRIQQILAYKHYVDSYERTHGEKPAAYQIRNALALDQTGFETLLQCLTYITLDSLDEPLKEGQAATLGDATPSGGDLESDLIQKEEQARLSSAVEAALLRLPPEEQAVIRSRYFDGLNDTQTADAVGITPAAVRRQCNRGLDHLRVSQELKEYRTEIISLSASAWYSVGFYKNHSQSGVEYAVERILSHEKGIERLENIRRSVTALNALDDIQKLIQSKAPTQ